MEFIDLAAQQKRIREKIEANIRAVLNHGKYIMGPEIKELEKRLSEYVGVKHSIGCSSGTDALLLGLMAYDIGPGDAIFTTPFTFIATAEVISLLGATPVFVDIDPKTFNISPENLAQVVDVLNSEIDSKHPLPSPAEHSQLNPRGIITVDLFGLPADYDSISAIAKKHGLFVIEDAAQSFGGVYKGQRACTFGDISCTSFFPAKPLGAYGDGGMCFTDNDELAERLMSLMNHGQGHYKYDNVRIGINGRLDTLQAAVLLAKLDIFPEEVRLRQKVAQRYSRLLRDNSYSIIPPYVPEACTSVWAQYSVLARDEAQRSILQTRLKEHGIPTAIYYPNPLHLQTAFASLGYNKGDFPISEEYATRIFSLPMHPYLVEEEQEMIAKILTSDAG
jgi:dTDP-4-amino-4,6-dideoxygalactose transaminase